MPTPTDTAIKKEGLALISPLSQEVEKLHIKTAQDYLEADELLGRVRSARRKWALKLSSILDPLKDAVAAAKKAQENGRLLFAEVDRPLEAMETGLKEEMREFKLEEQRQLQAAEAARLAEVERQNKIAAELAAKEAKARTNPMRERLAEARRLAESRVQEVEEQKAPVAIKGASSASRKVQKWRVTDLQALVKAVAAGDVPLGVLDINAVAIGMHFRQDAEVVKQWPGVEVYDDIVIAGR